MKNLFILSFLVELHMILCNDYNAAWCGVGNFCSQPMDSDEKAQPDSVVGQIKYHRYENKDENLNQIYCLFIFWVDNILLNRIIWTRPGIPHFWESPIMKMVFANSLHTIWNAFLLKFSHFLLFIYYETFFRVKIDFIRICYCYIFAVCLFFLLVRN